MRVVVMAEIELDAVGADGGLSATEEVLQEAFGRCQGASWKVWLKQGDGHRDPRFNPEPGDRVEKAGSKRRVCREVRRVDNGAVQYVVDGKSVVCRLSTWLNWCRGADVREDVAKKEDGSDGQAAESDGASVVQVR
jgi:hypothetical protein